MPTYRIHRMKEGPRQQFRWAPHTIGTTAVKRKDYEESATVEADSPYLAWAVLRRSQTPLELGDILESENGALAIYKYVGFEQAQWTLPEAKGGGESAPPEVSASAPVSHPGTI